MRILAASSYSWLAVIARGTRISHKERPQAVYHYEYMWYMVSVRTRTEYYSTAAAPGTAAALLLWWRVLVLLYWT